MDIIPSTEPKSLTSDTNFLTILYLLMHILRSKTIWQQRENAVTLPHSAQRKHAFLGEIKQLSRTNKLATRKKIDL